jgi:DNA repair protein SbcC/Rad50
VLQATDTAIRLGDLVSARSSANTRRLTLQAYAVQHRFKGVLEAATVHLERMSGGHFALELDDSSSGNAHAGLGITVRDVWSNTVRDTKALSGGETFIASLALALGLADVVREENGGVDLNTLFVDEGFGSLDQESLQQVLDQLDSLRSRGRVVGVISHVTEMKDWVHDWLRIVPGPRGTGSRIQQSD